MVDTTEHTAGASYETPLVNVPHCVSTLTPAERVPRTPASAIHKILEWLVQDRDGHGVPSTWMARFNDGNTEYDPKSDPNTMMFIIPDVGKLVGATDDTVTDTPAAMHTLKF